MKAKQIRIIYYYLELKFRRRDPYVDIRDLQRDTSMREEDVIMVVDSLIAARVIKKVYHPESPTPELQMDMNFRGLRRMI
jgi:hypothetical protein